MRLGFAVGGSLLLLLPLALSLTPIVLVPGDGGSQVEARLDGKPKVPHYFCSKTSKDFFPIWLNINLLVPYIIDCFVDNFRLVFDPKTNVSSNAPKVAIRIPEFGNTEAVEYFDASHISYSAYFNSLVSNLVKLGYQKNVSVRGAPYDFRRAINDNPDFFVHLKQLVEQTFAVNNKTKVLLVAHSMGNPMMLHFFQQQSQAWKDQYVRAFFAVSGPFAGAVKPLRLEASGDSLSIPFERPLAIRPLQRSFTSSAFLMPFAPFWNSSEILASRPEKNYTVHDYREFFEDMDFADGYQMRESSIQGYDPSKPPGVEVHCIYGYGIDTPSRFDWKDWPDSQPAVTHGDGDGTVNMRSLHSCYNMWFGKQKQGVFRKEIKDAEHLKILHTSDFLNYTISFITDGKRSFSPSDKTLYYVP